MAILKGKIYDLEIQIKIGRHDFCLDQNFLWSNSLTCLACAVFETS